VVGQKLQDDGIVDHESNQQQHSEVDTDAHQQMAIVTDDDGFHVAAEYRSEHIDVEHLATFNSIL